MRLHFLHRIRIVSVIVAPTMAGLLTIVAVAQMPDGAVEMETYWEQPLAGQGEPPKNWTAIERSLSPKDCGQCHGDQYAQWQTSLHAHSFSPGVAGQVLAYTPEDTAACLQCHAPLAEQRTALEAARNLGAAALSGNFVAAGDVCAGCHLRYYRHFGPPQRGTGATGASPLPAPHGGVLRTTLFESAEFCRGCHQFPASVAVNGKPLLNTFVEWRASPQAARGMVCQTCHMPERKHLWRGIHDPAMVASGLTPHMTANAAGVRFEIANTGVGHAFPTYATPKVVMHAVALDAAGAPRADTLRSREIARSVRWADDHWIELADTRLFPGQSAAIELEWGDSDRIRVWLEVIPDDDYEANVYPRLLAELPANGDSQRLILEARAHAAATPYRLFETELQRP